MLQRFIHLSMRQSFPVVCQVLAEMQESKRTQSSYEQKLKEYQRKVETLRLKQESLSADLIKSQKDMIALHEHLLQSKTEQVTAVQEAV